MTCPAVHWTGVCQRPEGHRGRHRGRAGEAETTWGNTAALSLDDLVYRAAHAGDHPAGEELAAVVELILALAETVDDMLGPQPQPQVEPQPQPDPDSTTIHATGQRIVPASIYMRPEGDQP